ncbi:MAG TPA: signal peptidase I [Spirochaetota bacterium]|nr:signal peptidase I [Spirochaetota bacterium]HOD14138.1 signal peptidase I [Spirochaetota bacterium]HPG49184.1 signal peptidase I [Spirochaetota bacterium]HPN10765.1 signal peptidase I [Spirochaetota bacterium]HQL81022.1 signal peptidase I [Spirochaetota bacterium]
MGIRNMSGAVARRRNQLMLLFAGLVVLSFAVPLAVVMVMFRTFFVPSAAMGDTLLAGDNIVVRQVLYRPVERGDVVVFRQPAGEGSYYLKRCVAVAGDRLAFRDGALILNDKTLEEPYVKGKTYPAAVNGAAIEGMVPKGMIAVLGDNRENSKDSRHFGLVDEAGVKGKAVLIYWNREAVAKSGFTHMGMIR